MAEVCFFSYFPALISQYLIILSMIADFYESYLSDLGLDPKRPKNKSRGYR